MILKIARVIRENPDRSMVQFTIFTNLLLIFMIMAFFALKSHYIKQTPYTSTAPVKTNLCFVVMDSILKKEIHPQMGSKQVKLALRNTSYKALKLNFDEEILHVFDTSQGCKIILKDKIGLRAFDFKLSGSGLNPFYYEVTQITEKDVQGEE